MAENKKVHDLSMLSMATRDVAPKIANEGGATLKD